MIGLALAGIFLLTACGKKAPACTKYIPKESNYVMAIDVQRIMGKLQKDSLSVENVMEAFKDSSSDYTKAVLTWKDFKDAGIDFSNKIFVSAAVSSFIGNGESDFELIGGVKDASKLEAFIKKQSSTSGIKKGDGFSYASQNNMVVGWNDDAVIIVGAHKNNFNGYEMDSANSAIQGSQANDAMVMAAEKLKKYFKLEKSESIASVDAFKDLMGKTADVAIFSSTNTATFPAMVSVLVPKLKDLTDGLYSTTIVNFEDGKAEVTLTGFIGEKLAALIKKYPSKNVDLSMVDNYPSNNIDGLMAISFNTQLIPALIREAGADAGANLGLSQMGMNIDDLAKVFKGDFVFGMSDFGMAKKQFGTTSTDNFHVSVPSVKLLFAAKIGDKAAFDKLISIGEKQGFLIRQGNSLLVASNGTPLQGTPYVISLANDMLTISSDSATLVGYLAKTQKIGLTDEVKNKFKATSGACYVDFDKIFSGFGNDTLDSNNTEGKKTLEMAKTTFNYAWLTTGSFDGKKIESKGELVFINPKKNSLSQLVKFGIYAAQQQRTGQAKREKMYKQEDVMLADTTRWPPATK